MDKTCIYIFEMTIDVEEENECCVGQKFFVNFLASVAATSVETIIHAIKSTASSGNDRRARERKKEGKKTKEK